MAPHKRLDPKDWSEAHWVICHSLKGASDQASRYAWGRMVGWLLTLNANFRYSDFELPPWTAPTFFSLLSERIKDDLRAFADNPNSPSSQDDAHWDKKFADAYEDDSAQVELDRARTKQLADAKRKVAEEEEEEKKREALKTRLLLEEIADSLRRDD